jgi:hypothetical protein
VLGDTTTQWWHVEIVNGHALDEEALQALFQNQRNVYYFSLEGVKQSDKSVLLFKTVN